MACWEDGSKLQALPTVRVTPRALSLQPLLRQLCAALTRQLLLSEPGFSEAVARRGPASLSPQGCAGSGAKGGQTGDGGSGWVKAPGSS